MIKDNIVDVKKRIAAACAKAGRGPDSVSLVAITKEREVEQIVEALEAGISDIGENRVQEAALKFKKISSAWQGDKIKFHMVGHLQNNKVKDAVKLFDLIHSVDSLNLAGEINKQAASLGKAQDILIQVNTSAEATKFGVTPEEALEMVLEAGKMKNISVCGLMTIAPLVDDPEKVRLYFRRLRELRD